MFYTAHLATMPPIDPRRIVGGSCWAKSTSVSNDSRRIYGVEASKMWLRGTVIEVMNIRPEGGQRSTTWIKAKYHVGNAEKIKLINIAQLKKEDPNAVTPPSQVPAGGSSLQNLEQSSAPGNVQATDVAAASTSPPAVSTAPETATVAAIPGSNQTQATSTSNTSSVRLPIATAHDRQWFEGDTELPTNGPFTRKTWKAVCQYTGKEFTPGCDQAAKQLTSLDFFMSVFPSSQLKLMVDATSQRLMAEGKPRTTKGEVLKWLGVLLLITRFEFGDRRSLWSNKPSCKYVPAANFGERTGMTRDRFETLFRLMVWSIQPAERPDEMSHEAYRWRLVEDFLDNFNRHREQFFSPSWLMCADESISRWYGLGGHWINIGLPMYVSMDRKPEDGLEIQNICCAKSGIMCRLKLVKTAAANAE